MLDTLSQNTPPSSFSLPSPPEEVLPLAEDEILVLRSGGTVDVEGVKVTAIEPGFPAFKNSQKYLLFLSLDPTRKIGSVRAGATGAMKINVDNTLGALDKEPLLLQKQIEARHGKSVDKLKSEIKVLSIAR